MKKYPTVFNLAYDVFTKAKAPFVLIGGFAINYYKVTRQTMDIDFMIREDDYELLLKLFKEAGYREDYRQKAFARLKGNEYYLMDIDLMFVNQDTISKILSESKDVEITGQKFKIPSLNHLIVLKLHALKNNYKLREMKDLPDIVNVIRAHKLDIESKDFKELFLKYGTEEIYNKILELI
jgi:predicted nucleotidyltransferase